MEPPTEAREHTDLIEEHLCPETVLAGVVPELELRFEEFVTLFGSPHLVRSIPRSLALSRFPHFTLKPVSSSMSSSEGAYFPSLK